MRILFISIYYAIDEIPACPRGRETVNFVAKHHRKDIPTKDHQPSCLPERPAPSRWWFPRFCSGPQKQTFQQWSVDAAWCSQIGWSCDQLVGGCACYIPLYLPLYVFDIVFWCFLLFHGGSSFLYLLFHIHCKASCPRALHGSWDIWLQASVVPVTSKDVPVKPTHEPPPTNQTQLKEMPRKQTLQSRMTDSVTVEAIE